MIIRYYNILRYDLPLHFVLWITNFLPDLVACLRLRGLLASPFFLSCGKNLRLGRNITFYNSSKISIGSNVYIAYGCWMMGVVQIEDEVIFGPYCVIAPGNHKLNNGSFRFETPSQGVIKVKFGSWIGAHSVIVGENTVHGSGSILAANRTLIKSSKNNSIYAGTPASKVKSLTEYDD
jgi:acetyltransferase-like isoleucine patch superfamily enzyme